jgi:hypothetical protein
MQLATYPLTVAAANTGTFHANLTEAGKAKIDTATSPAELDMLPGIDYVVGCGDDKWQPFPATVYTERFRHSWVMVYQERPRVPVFQGCPMLKTKKGQEERNAMILLAYFKPWTLDEAITSEHVPHVARLRSQESWVESQAEYLNGNVLCETTMQYINNFFCVNRLRPANAEHDEANSDDLLSDEDVQLSTEDLAHVLQTRKGGRETKEGATGKRGTDDDDAEANTHHENSSTAMDLAQDIWGLADGKKDRKNPTFKDIPRNLDEVFRAAARSQSCAVEATARSQAAERPVDLSTRHLPSGSEMRRW